MTVTVTVTQGLASQTDSSTSSPKGPTSSDASSQAAATTSSDQQAMKVGLGVGIPLGILPLAAVGYLIWELRKKRQAMGEGIKPVFEADNRQTSAALASGVALSPAPKYEQYSQQQSFPSTELSHHDVAY